MGCILLAVVINSIAIKGVDGYVVKIEVDTKYGQPLVAIIGLGDTSVKEAKERLEATNIHRKYVFPKMKIVINLAPGDIKKSRSHFDLAMAIGLLIQSEQIKADNMDSFALIGELSLNGELRACTGVLPMTIPAKSNGINNIIISRDNLEEASFVSRINIFEFENLDDVISFLNGTNKYNSLL